MIILCLTRAETRDIISYRLYLLSGNGFSPKDQRRNVEFTVTRSAKNNIILSRVRRHHSTLYYYSPGKSQRPRYFLTGSVPNTGGAELSQWRVCTR